MYRLELREVLGATDPLIIYINSRVTQLSWSTGPGGFVGLEVGIRERHVPQYGYLTEPIEEKPFADVRLLQGSWTCWRGRIVETLVGPAGMLGFTAEGYGVSALSDNILRSTSDTLLPATDIIRTALFSTNSRIVPDAAPFFDAPEEQYTLMAFDLDTPATIMDQMAKVGSGSAIWDFAVWEDGYLRMAPRQAPATPDYSIPWDDTVEPLRKDYRKVYGSMILSIQDEDGTERRIAGTNPDFTERYKLFRRAGADGGSMTQRQARTCVNTWLTSNYEPVLSTTVTRSGDRGLELYPAGERPGYQVRFGEYLSILDGPPMLIVATSHDANENSVQIDVGAVPPSIPGVLLDHSSQLAYHRLDRNPLTGARKRRAG
jgi:hypothetical protein